MRCPDTQRSAVLLSGDDRFCMEGAGLETRNRGKCCTGISLVSGMDLEHGCMFPPLGFSVPHRPARVTQRGDSPCMGAAWGDPLCLRASCQEEDMVPVPTTHHSMGLCVCCFLQPPLPVSAEPWLCPSATWQPPAHHQQPAGRVTAKNC